MSTTLNNVYRDVKSRITELDIDEEVIHHYDIIRAINDAVRALRIEYVKNEVGGILANTERLSSLTEDTEYPFLKSDTLTDNILDDVPIELAVLSSTAYITSDTIQNSAQSFTKGDIARKNGDLYECTETFSSVNTYDAVFDQRNYRTFHRANGLDYKQGDIVYVKATDQYYEVNTDFTNTEDADADSLAELDKLYWKRIGDSDIFVSHYPVKNLQVLRTFEDLGRIGALTVRGDTVYTTKNVVELVITYVPQWTDVEDLASTLDIPDMMVPEVKNQASQSLAAKLNVKLELNKDNA